MVCTFFGHRQVSKEIEPTLRSALVDLIENKGVNRFYVGNHGGFDAMVQRMLKELAASYPIKFYVVLAYLPEKRRALSFIDEAETLLPDGIETVPKRFAISYRNKWMVEKSDYAVTYVTHHIGSGAAAFKSLAERRGKTVIEIGNKQV